MLQGSEINARLSRLEDRARAQIGVLPQPFPKVVLFLSASDGTRRADVVDATGDSFDDVWRHVVKMLRTRVSLQSGQKLLLRLDWADAAELTTWGKVRTLLAATKRNYFRYGLAADPQFKHAYTEQELNANAMLYGGNGVENAVLNEKNWQVYACARRSAERPLSFPETGQAVLFSTRGIFLDQNGQLHDLNPVGLDTGRRHVASMDSSFVRGLVADGSRYLSRQVKPDGRFVYGYHPCFDRRIETYNALRHASTTYAMIEAWEVTADCDLSGAIKRALTYLTTHLVRTVTLPDGTEAAFLVDQGNEIKLGGCAVAILALAKYDQVTGSGEHADLLEKLALGVRSMQDASSGAFVHVLNYPNLEIKQQFRTVYYDGEAAFGLMRLYGLTLDPRWLYCVEKAFEHFIARNHWRHHDHWLGYCVNELTKYRPDERYFRFGVQNIAGHLDFVEKRITTFPTLLELMMAARETLSRIALFSDLHHLFAEIDLAHFDRALEARAAYLINGHFWPELAMFFRRPDGIAGSFFIRHHAFRVRIDDVEHYLSGLIAYERYLGERDQFRDLVRMRPVTARVPAAPSVHPSLKQSPDGWTPEAVQAATGGEWIRRPTDRWRANGLATFAPAARTGDLLVVRSATENIGVLKQVVQRLAPPAGVVVSDIENATAFAGPVLRVPDTGAAVLAMGAYARSQMGGKIAGVTGSAGKTTMVAMLAHALSPLGAVALTRHNANLPIGVAWNLASIPWNTPSIVLELAIGRMAVSARMARPDVAIFTNVLPAHLGERATVTDIAKTKSAIFLGMRPGGVAVLNAEMEKRDFVEEAARRCKLDIIWYGCSDACDYRLDDYDIRSGTVCASAAGRKLIYRLGALGRHMAINSIAALAAVAAMGHSLESALATFESFTALPGRGEQVNLTVGGRHLTIIDDAYNANPGSMSAAIDQLSAQPTSGRRIAVLGHMAELGPHAASYHTELAAHIAQRTVDRVYVAGDLYTHFWDRIPADRRGFKVSSVASLREGLLAELQDGDTVLIKGSNSARMHELVSFIKGKAQS